MHFMKIQQDHNQEWNAKVGDGMTTTIGRVEKEELFDHGLKYMLFSHNKKMGSAKGAVLLAEMLYKKGKI